MAALVAFRAAVYAAFGARRDALFDLLEALLTAGPVAAAVHLRLAPAHRRGHGSLYATFAPELALLEKIPGVRRTAAAELRQELGADMGVFVSAKHLASWAGVSPGNRQSGAAHRHVA